MGQQKVDLSTAVEDAIAIGKRRTYQPVVLEVDAGQALSEGVIIEKASQEVYIAEYIPARFIEFRAS